MSAKAVHTPVEIGVVGVGRIGTIHATTVAQHIHTARLTTVTDTDAHAARALAADLDIPFVTESYEAMLADERLDAVLICTNTDTHAHFIKQAAEAGKHIFCEKPIATDLATIDDALAAVKAAGVKLMVGFNRRFDANHARIKQAITEGEIGVPNLMHLISRDPSPPPLDYVRDSGGMFLDMTIHDFDTARFLYGEVDTIYAAAGVLIDPGIGDVGDIDTAVLTLHFENGAIGTIDNCRRAIYGYDQRVEVFGSKGSASSANVYPNTVTLSTAQAIQRDLPLNFFIDRYAASFRAEIEAFVECLIDDTPPPVTGQDGRQTIVMAIAAKQSLDEGRPVKVAEFQ